MGTLARGLELYLRLDGRLVDESGNGNNGTGIDSPTFSIGIYGQALSLNGTSQRVDLGINTIPAAMNGGSGVTFTALIKQTADVAAEKFVVGIPVNGINNGFVISIHSKNLNVGGRSRQDDSYQSATATDVIQPNTWYFITGVLSYLNKTITIYINGDLVLNQADAAFGSSTFVNGPQTAHARIGMTPSIVSPRYFNGQIQNAMIYNRALAAHEIRQLYALGSPIGIV